MVWKRPERIFKLKNKKTQENFKISNNTYNGTPLQFFCLENPMDREAW